MATLTSNRCYCFLEQFVKSIHLRCQTVNINIASDSVRVVPRLDNVFRRINHHPVDIMGCFVNTYSLATG